MRRGFCLRSGHGARFGGSEFVLVVLRIGHGSRILLGGDVAVGVEPESYEKLSKKLSSAPFCTALQERTPRPYLLELCERVSCMLLSSMVPDSTKVSVVTFDAVRGFDILFRAVLMVYWGGVTKSLFISESSA